MKEIIAVPKSKDQEDALKVHIFGTYMTLRVGMGVIAAAFPLMLYVVGRFHGITLQGSMSAYYWAGAEGVIAPRTIFVGGLLALSAFFYLYKGFTVKENLALNFAAIFAALVAFFPMSWNCSINHLPPLNVYHCPSAWNPHGTCAVALFICLAYVSLFRSHDTLPALENNKLQHRFSVTYVITGALMVASPLIAAVMRVWFDRLDSYTYFVELSGILAFAAYWIVKSIELKKSKLVDKVLDLQLPLSAAPLQSSNIEKIADA